VVDFECNGILLSRDIKVEFFHKTIKVGRDLHGRAKPSLSLMTMHDIGTDASSTCRA